MDVEIESGGLRLRGHLARGAPDGARTRRHGLVLCHGFPVAPRDASVSGESYADLADRIAAESGWLVLACNFRGTGESEGDFSLGGWLADLRAAIDFVDALSDVDGVWLAGFSTGGSLALCAAGEDERVRGVAAFAALADFDDWAADADAFLARCRELGVIRGPKAPAEPAAWVRELSEIRPLRLVGKIPPRSVLVVHGSEDEMVNLMDARALADAADGEVELRVLTGAGHRLRQDPRAIAVLLGWLDRQNT